MPRRPLLVPLLAGVVAAGAAFAAVGRAQAAPVPGAPVVAIDPGHDSQDVGASASVGGARLVEKDLTLAVARQTADLLQQAGYRVVLTRQDDAPPNGSRDVTGDRRVDLADDLQARIDRANADGAAVLLSIHFNGSKDARFRGTEVYFSPDRPFARENQRLAEAVFAAVQARLREVGVRLAPRGVQPDKALGGGPLYLLGPAGGRIARASRMPGALVEGLYLSNADDARLLTDPRVLQALAHGCADGVAEYLGPPARQAVVTGPAGANLRPSPLLTTRPLAVLPRGTPLELAELAYGDAVRGLSNWWRVDWDGHAGFVFAPLVTPTAPLAPAPPLSPPAAGPAPGLPERATVRDDDGLPARLRGAPSRQAPILVRARPNEQLEVLGTTTGEAVDGRQATWLKVRRGNTIGWVWSPLLDAAQGG